MSQYAICPTTELHSFIQTTSKSIMLFDTISNSSLLVVHYITTFIYYHKVHNVTTSGSMIVDVPAIDL